ncbi:cytochrome P450 [Paraburkholderia sp. MM5384-R2]|uniref:cytochrome P450 n=1 Tax=Paraburkholderia sp. MM5384-R2 TaxID=2723097 RepID=UPI001621B163|nr:cytochrome P450 [Paraburkholderia sp. MM5384-R2]MBB5498665.1 cytochrome P450 [Paraburkholderia sp. MM5384-R2]
MSRPPDCDTVIDSWPVPGHVPRELIRDVDIYRMPGASTDVHAAWAHVAATEPPVFYTPRHGGYWVLNRAELIAEAFGDHERFASSGAISIPPLPEQVPPQLPIMADPPEHRYFRLPLNLAVSPKRLAALSEMARALAIELIEGFRPFGRCEFVQDFAMHLPMTIFLYLVDLPLKDRAWLISQVEVMPRAEDEAARIQAYNNIIGYLEGWLEKRAAEPGEDLISRILQVKIGDRPITRQEALSEAALSLFGGLDTVASTMGLVARFLAENPDYRKQLIDEPGLIPNAVEELLRRWAIPSVARRVTQNLEFGGVKMKRGDLLILTTSLHGLDPHFWENAREVDFRRPLANLMTFGRGVHKCPGALLARAELRIFLEEWLRRIPDFSIDPQDPPVTAGGNVIGMLRLPLAWPIR